MVEVHTPSITNLDDQNEQEPREECGVYGVWAPGEEVSKLTYFGLFALQHRGQEAAGIAVGDDDRIVVFKDMGSEFAFLTRSTIESKETIEWEDGNEYPLIKLEVTSDTHPFYTGKQNIMDTTGKVERFNRRFGMMRGAKK